MRTLSRLAFLTTTLGLCLALEQPLAAAQENLEGANPLPTENLEARVTAILEERVTPLPDSQAGQLYQKLTLLVTKGSLKGEAITVENGLFPVANWQKYQVDDQVIVTYSQGPEGEKVFYISDYLRRRPLFWLLLIFVILTVLVAKGRGVSSLVGMAASFLVIFKFILPQISHGANPILIAIIGSLFIIPFTFYLSHGVNRKTTVAIVGTVIALVVTGLLAGVFVGAARLTGFASEEAGFLQATALGTINIKGLLLAGIIIGVLGVLDDITVSQAAVVAQLRAANPRLPASHLYHQAMNVGRDHISSMVNTLILVYTGASLPLLLLFVDNPHSFTEVINYEVVAEEVVRTLVGSIGLILAVPVTTLIAAFSTEAA